MSGRSPKIEVLTHARARPLGGVTVAVFRKVTVAENRYGGKGKDVRPCPATDESVIVEVREIAIT